MKKVIYLIVCLLMPVVWAWGATVTDLSDWNGNTYGKLTVDGTSAIIEFYDNTTVNTNFNTEPITQVMKDLTEVKVKGTIPNSVNQFFNVDKNGHGFTNCQRMDFSKATENVPTDISRHENVTSVILPEGSSLNSITLPNPKPHQSDLYVIVANDGDSEHPLDVLVKKGTAWASDPFTEDASYINVYDADGTTPLNSDEVTALQQTKVVNGVGTVVAVEDLTINADTEDEGTVLNNFLDSGKMIKNLTVTGGLSDLTLFDGVNVKKDVDFSGITNSDLSTLKLPTTTGTISLPGGSYKNGVITLADGYTDAQLNNIFAALSNSGKSVSEIVFPGGSTFNTSTNALEVTTADEDGGKFGAIADAIRGAGYTIESVKLEKYGTSWSNNIMTLAKTHADQEESQEELLVNAGFPVNDKKVTNFPDIEISEKNGVVTITSYRAGALEDLFKNENNNDEEAIAYKQILQNNQGEGHKLVLVGPFKGPDLNKLKEKNYNSFETVDMSNATFNNANDAKFTYFDANMLKTAYMSNDPKVTTITEDCFRNMNNIQKLYVGESVTEIPDTRFQDKSSLQYVYIPNSVRTIGKSAFQNCTNLSKVEYGDNPTLSIIDVSAFEKTAITGVLEIPNSVTRIEAKAFKGCLEITSIVINKDSNLEYIGEETFRMDDSSFKLKDVYVYAEKEIECHSEAWDYYATDGQTVMSTVRTRLHYPPAYYSWYVGDWKADMNGGKIEGHDDLLNLRNAVDRGTFTADDGTTKSVTPKGQIGWQKFISSGIPVTFDMDWRTYSDIVDLKVPEYASRVADVYIVCGYQDGKAVLKQMKENDIIPAGTGLVIHHYVTNQQNGGVLFFPHVTPQEASAAVAENPDALKPYRFVSDGDKRGSAGESEWNKDEYAFAKGMNYVGIETRDYVCDGKSYHNYLEAIHCMGVKRAIYNAENGNYIDYNTLEMKAYSGQKVTYRNFFFGNGEKLQASMNAGSIGSGKDWDANTDGKMGWGFFRCMTDMYAINSKAFLHYPADVFTQSHSASPGTTITEGVIASAKTFDNMILLDEDYSSPSSIATGITTVNHEATIKNEGFYTIQGVKVSTPIKNGLYIHNGKKYVVK